MDESIGPKTNRPRLPRILLASTFACASWTACDLGSKGIGTEIADTDDATTGVPGGSDDYEPCANKGCGEPCMMCAPGDPGCGEDATPKACDANGACVSAPDVVCETSTSGDEPGDPPDDPTDGTGCDDPGGDPGPDLPPPSCVETPMVIPLDEVTPLGFSPRDMLNLAEGTHQKPMTEWHESFDDAGFVFEMGPESGLGELTVSIDHDGGEVRFVDREEVEGRFPLFDCYDTVEIEATAQVTSSGGALAETVPVVLTATVPGEAEIAAELSVAALNGSFWVNFVSHNAPSDIVFDTDPAILRLRFSPVGMGGSFYGWIEFERAVPSATPCYDSEGLVIVDYATFP